jgi:hypothetical protein
MSEQILAKSELYAKYNIKVLWVKPLPDIFAQLRKKMSLSRAKQPSIIL